MEEILIIVLPFAIIGIFLVIKNRRINKFQQTAKMGDVCAFYVEEERQSGDIIASGVNEVIITNISGTVSRSRNEIYPL